MAGDLIHKLKVKKMLKQILNLGVDAATNAYAGNYTKAIADAVQILVLIVNELDAEQKTTAFGEFPSLQGLVEQPGQADQPR